jgi:hypothetical protein
MNVKSNEQHENKEQPCRIVGCKKMTQAARGARTAGATWTCTVHRRMLTLSSGERAVGVWRDGPRSFATGGSSKAVARGPMDAFYRWAKADFEEPRGLSL